MYFLTKRHTKSPPYGRRCIMDTWCDDACCSVSAGPITRSRLFRQRRGYQSAWRQQLAVHHRVHGQTSLFDQHRTKCHACRRCQFRYAVKHFTLSLISFYAVIDSIDRAFDIRSTDKQLDRNYLPHIDTVCYFFTASAQCDWSKLCNAVWRVLMWSCLHSPLTVYAYNMQFSEMVSYVYMINVTALFELRLQRNNRLLRVAAQLQCRCCRIESGLLATFYFSTSEHI